MNVASTRCATKSRTWLLIAALTALLGGIGALIGGMFLSMSTIGSHVTTSATLGPRAGVVI